MQSTAYRSQKFHDPHPPNTEAASTMADPTKPDLNAIHDFLYALALKAGDMIISANPSKIDTKKNSSDLVTETDKAVEDMVSSTLKKKYPDYAYLPLSLFLNNISSYQIDN